MEGGKYERWVRVVGLMKDKTCFRFKIAKPVRKGFKGSVTAFALRRRESNETR